MSARTHGVLSILLAIAGVALIVSAAPSVADPSPDVGPIVVGATLLAVAVIVSRRQLRRVGAVRREVRRGIRQIETVLRLEATLTRRRLTVAGMNGGCPNCGAPPGPHCVCPKR